MKTINASEFKAKCLALLDKIAKTGEPLLILKHGKPIAELRIPSTTDQDYPQKKLIGSVSVVGDILSPSVEPEEVSLEDGLL